MEVVFLMLTYFSQNLNFSKWPIRTFAECILLYYSECTYSTQLYWHNLQELLKYSTVPAQPSQCSFSTLLCKLSLSSATTVT